MDADSQCRQSHQCKEKWTIQFRPTSKSYLAKLDSFIEREIAPLQAQDDNDRFFDHRREYYRTDWAAGGVPTKAWQALLAESRRRADAAGFFRFCLPREYGGSAGSNLWMAVIREHLAAKGLGLFNDLQNENSVVGNFPFVHILTRFGRDDQKSMIEGHITGRLVFAFGLTEPGHGSDATYLETTARPEIRNGIKGWLINGRKMWQTNQHVAAHCLVFARTSGRDGSSEGITAFFVPADTEGIVVESYEWTFNMPTDHATTSFRNVWVPESAECGQVGKGLDVAQSFVHENRTRQAAGSLGAAHYCIQESIRYSKERKPFGKSLASNQGIQFPLVELATQVEMLRLLIRKTASELDQTGGQNLEPRLKGLISMCNFWANRLCCQAADQAMQVHGGMGYSRHKPFEHIYRNHRRYRITEGSEEIQKRIVAAYLFQFGHPKPTEHSKL